ncbi:MAG: UDP-N-acetylmuramate--L-alanine ligase [Chitinophagaceae bacterium]|nr:UDP-N-acetylmuramate--L-alanine ligase [Chitinophagaceae bacterium]
MDIKNIQRIYFIGIGGIGMSALARYFKFHGRTVSGYDKTETVLTKQLAEEGIEIHYEDSVEKLDKTADVVVYTPAIPATQLQFQFYKENNFELLKRSDVLGLITAGSFNICVAGTHGKTTITTMIAHILRDSGYGCNAFLGGIAVNYESNFWSNERNVCVVEADEYDRSFLKLNPDIAVVTAMDADHLDIYGTAEAVESAFIDFTAKLKPEGILIHKQGLAKAASLHGSKKVIYGLDKSLADVRPVNITMNSGSYLFDVSGSGWQLQDVVLNMGGLHNVENITAAIAVAKELQIDDEEIRSAVESFKGVKRRFEYILKREDLVFVDDYAHHPEELRALITGAKGLFSNMRCILIFQPHLFSRTRDFADGFAESLDLADEVVVLPIYPARELPIEGVTSQLLIDKMKTSNKQLLEKESLLEWMNSMAGKRTNQGKTLLITAGAGDIDTLIEPIKQIIEK